MKIAKIGLLGLAVAGITAACGGGDDSSGGPSTPTATVLEGGTIGCPAGAKECISDTLARVCPGDGSAWLSLTCGAGEKCTNGDCGPDPGATCSPVMDTCVNGAAMRCKADGKGLEVVQCPANTACVGAGKCVGACEVGASSCKDTKTVSTCTDGMQETLTTCGDGQYCVTTDTGKAACKPSDCAPGACTVCGNKVDANADQTKFTSECRATPLGYKWEAVACANGGSCNPTGGGSCTLGSYGGYAAACTSTCAPGTTRCAPGLNGIETCDANGQWSASVTPCNPDPTVTNLVCMPSPSAPGSVVCGDRVCSNAQGACDETGKIRLCGPDGKLAAAATACTTGSCVATGYTYGGIVAGNCSATCQDGDQRCINGGSLSYEVCSGGVWGAPQSCATGSCYGYTNVLGRPAILCNAVCKPGTHRCTDAGGVAGGSTHVETCSTTGQWSAPAACTIGTCSALSSTSGTDYGCVAQCVPGSTLCMGSYAAGVGQFAGTSASGTCTADGKLPSTPTACDGDKVCRKNANGIAIGCVECLGPNHGGNAIHETDSRCTDAGGTAGGTTSTEFCQATDTWPATPTDCPSGTSCSVSQQSCGTCYVYNYNTSTYSYTTCTESNIRTMTNGSYGCNWEGSYYYAGACGSVSDCCLYQYGSGYCTSTGTGPATCH